eukprot:8651608-Prorocentrum_lima.AAC.1
MDPETRVDYLLSFLRPHFVKGTQVIYLYNMVQFMRVRRSHRLAETDHQVCTSQTMSSRNL